MIGKLRAGNSVYTDVVATAGTFLSRMPILL